MAYLDVEPARAIYFEHQVRGPTTVLLSHGWGMGCRVWDTTVAALNDAGISTVAYDHRCCGRSDKTFADVSIEALGGDVVALCDHLGLSTPILNGWSLGGAVVVEAARRMGSRIGGMVLTAAATPRFTRCRDFPHGGTPEDVAGTVAAVRADRVNVLHGLYHSGVFARDVSAQIKDWAWRIALEASPAADASLGALASLDQREALRGLNVPALVVIGGKDGVVVPAIQRAAADCLPQCTRVEFAASGHAPFIEEPAAYHAALLQFVRAVSGAGR